MMRRQRLKKPSSAMLPIKGAQRFLRPDINVANKKTHDNIRRHKDIVAELRGTDAKLNLQPVLLGSTSDGKYRAKTSDGDIVFLRVSESKQEMQQLKREYKMLEKLHKAGISVPTPIEFNYSDTAAYFIVEFVEGGDLLNSFQTISEDTAYEYGYKVGKLIHDIGMVDATNAKLSWENGFRSLVLRPLMKISEELKMDTPGLKETLNCAYSMRGVLASRPIQLIHSDLKPANIILNPGGSFKLVDWGAAIPACTTFACVHALDSFESISYTIGKFHAYFGGDPTYEDWKLISLYHVASAMSIVLNRVKQLKTAEPIHIERYSSTLISYDYLKNPVPGWYTNDHRTKAPQ